MNFQELVPNVGTSAAPGFINLTTVGGTITGSFSYLAWKGESGGETSSIWWTSAQNNSPDSNGEYEWASPGILKNAQTSDSPSLASFNGIPYIAWKGAAADPSIYFGTLFENAATAGMGANSSNAPAIVGTDKALFMAWKGEPGDTRLFWARSTDGKTWKTHNALQWGGTTAGTCSTPALVAAGSTVYMVWTGATKNTIWWSKYTEQTGTWSEQTMIPCSSTGLTSTGPAVYCHDGTLTVAWKGISGSAIYFSTMVDDGKNKWSAQCVRYIAETSDRPALFNNPASPGNPMLFWKGVGAGIYYGLLNLPAQSYNLALENFKIITLRSGNILGTATDTDFVSISLSVNGKHVQSANAAMGDCNSGDIYNTNPLGLNFNIKLLDTDIVAFSYHITNSSGNPSQVMQYVNSVTSALVTGYFNVVEDYTGVDIKDPAEQRAFIAAEIVLNIGIPLIGTALAVLAAWLVGTDWNIFFPVCDGPVANAIHSFSGAQLRGLCAESVYTITENHPGVNSPDGCGDNSDYNVTWSILPLFNI